MNLKRNIINNGILFLFILIKFLIQYHLIADGFELHRDEFLHLDQARHLAWGFVSIPPVTSWISYLILLLGNSVFWVKFFLALFGALTIVVVWKSIEALNGGIYARILGAMGTLFSAYLRINTLYQPNSFDILCWAFLFYCVIKYIGSKENKWLYWFAVGLGLGFLNKYNITFLLLGLVPALILTEHRSVFKQKPVYIAVCIALLIIAPNLIWQFQHRLPVISHMEELASSQLAHVNRMDIVTEQILFFIPSLFILIFAFIGFSRYKPFKEYRVVAITYIITISLFIFFRGKPYYCVGLYPILLAFGSVYLEQLTTTGYKRYFRPAMLFIILILGIAYIPLTCPIFSVEKIETSSTIKEFYQKIGQLKWEDGKEHNLPQDYADMIGWKELTGITDSAWKRLTEEEKEKTIILCSNYGQAGAINYYAKEYPAAVSPNADYKNWFPDKVIENIILVRWKNNAFSDDYKKVFSSIEYIGAITNTSSREYGSSVYLLRNPSRIVYSEELK